MIATPSNRNVMSRESQEILVSQSSATDDDAVLRSSGKSDGTFASLDEAIVWKLGVVMKKPTAKWNKEHSTQWLFLWFLIYSATRTLVSRIHFRLLSFAFSPSQTVNHERERAFLLFRSIPPCRRVHESLDKRHDEWWISNMMLFQVKFTIQID